jgi:hypothetical protein
MIFDEPLIFLAETGCYAIHGASIAVAVTPVLLFVSVVLFVSRISCSI